MKGENIIKKRRPRDISLIFDFGKPTRLTSVGITHDNQIEFFQDGVQVKPVCAHTSVSYKKKSGRKKLYKFDLDVNNLSIDAHSSLSGSFDLAYAIDTNSKLIKTDIVSVTSIVLCKVYRIVNEKRSLATFAPVHWFEFRNILEKPENFAWQFAIERIIANPAYNNTMNICLIVDSDYGNIDRFNSREKPIFADFCLPNNFKLAYASARSGKAEYLPNILIATCDKESRSLLRHIEENFDDSSNLKESGAPFYSHFRNWLRD